MIRPYVTVNLTTGFGNNLFQYSFARMLAEYHNLELATRGIKELGINSTLAKQKSNQYSTKTIKHRGYQTGIYQDCFTHKYENRNLNIASGYSRIIHFIHLTEKDHKLVPNKHQKERR